MKTSNNNISNETKNGMSQGNNIITEAEGVKVGDKVRHNKHEEVATVTAIREAFVNRADGYRYLYTLDFGQSVLGPFQVELNGGEFLREAFTLYEASEISDPEGRKFRDFETWNGKTVKAEERQKWAKFFADGISNKVKFGGEESTYKHNAGCITVRVAYTNGTKNPEDMTYCVTWYRWTDTESENAEIVECENGVSIWVAARHMADFHLLADKFHFQTVDEILNPCERPQAA